MCRVAGVINASLQIEELQALIKGMCRVQQHGGPDDEGMYTNESNHLVVGHRRLSIIDISTDGHQPMSYANGRFVISYNGELYNYIELRNELKQAGYSFTTQSDTEVILAAYMAWGTAAFERFSGMFAFAIWDNKTNNILLARDAAGIKPIYYAHTVQGFAFASEVRALKTIGYLQTPNNNWPVYLMAYGHLPEPVTTLKYVQPLQKGTWLQYNAVTGAVVNKHFTRYKYLEKIDRKEEALQLIKETLDTAVKQHLISDAPIGVFLSGGLDSSVIAMLANRHQAMLNTISIYFENSNYSEKKYQDVLQQQLSCSHQQFLLSENEFHSFLPSIISDMDLPCCDGINTWFISKYARECGLKAVLSGIGGDELYGGYPSFNRIATALQVQQHLPDALLRAGRFAGIKKLRRFCYLSIKGSVGMYLFLRGQFIPHDIAQYLNCSETAVWRILEEQPLLPDIANLTAKNQASWLEVNLYMQNQLLRDADVMSMANGLEIRVPFLDAAFLKLSLQICSSIKYAGAFNKQLLIDSFKASLPKAVWNRPKMGFSFPFKDWLGRDQYADSHTGTKNAAYHRQFVAGKLHWSQFLTVFLIENHRDG